MASFSLGIDVAFSSSLPEPSADDYVDMSEEMTRSHMEDDEPPESTLPPLPPSHPPNNPTHNPTLPLPPALGIGREGSPASSTGSAYEDTADLAEEMAARPRLPSPVT